MPSIKYINKRRHSSNEGRGKSVSHIGVIVMRGMKMCIEKGEDAYFVFDRYRGGYIDGDRVRFVQSRAGIAGKMPEAKPVGLIERTRSTLLAEISAVMKGKVKLRILGMFGEKDIVYAGTIDGAIGDIFQVRYDSFGEIEIGPKFASKNDTSKDERIVFFASRVRMEFSDEVLQAASTLSLPNIETTSNKSNNSSINVQKGDIPHWMSRFPESVVDGKKRTDFRNVFVITIDGADAKDLDDAVSLELLDNGNSLLSVHIADVSEYVREDSVLDKEAILRSTSIYTPGRVIPMLPEKISNELCSLHPGTPKLTLSILMEIDSKGMVKNRHITEGIIESKHRGIYDDIWLMIEGKTKIEDPELGQLIPRINTLYHTLAERRKKEGKITFDSTEVYFDLSKDGEVLGIKKRERNDAHMLIEECMVLANEEVAKWCAEKKLPFLSRTHGLPTFENIDIILELIGLKNLKVKLEPHHIRTHLEKVTDPREKYRLSRLLLPKMAKAIYSDKPFRHFGLALEYYSHFTSPIRRYPDLQIHRIIKEYLRLQLTEKRKAHYIAILPKIAKKSSQLERQAEDISRTIDDIYLCRYMSKYVGQTFDGIISGLTESNIYVELSNGADGSIYLAQKNNSQIKGVKLVLDEVGGALVDKTGESHYSIGDAIRVKVMEVDMASRRVELREIDS